LNAELKGCVLFGSALGNIASLLLMANQGLISTVRERPIRMQPKKVVAQDSFELPQNKFLVKFGISKKLTMNVANILREDLQKEHVDFSLEI